MRVLIACEFSGIVRDAFAARGHYAMSCDLLPTESPGMHYQGDVFDIINDGWDMMIAHPPCTHLCVSGARFFAEKIKDGRQKQGIGFFISLTKTKIPKWCIENPVGIMSTIYRKPNQIINPWMFGHAEKKSTCLWLYNLPVLEKTKDVRSEMLKLPKNKQERLHYLPPGDNRWKERSKTYIGIAQAMAEQWGAQ